MRFRMMIIFSQSNYNKKSSYGVDAIGSLYNIWHSKNNRVIDELNLKCPRIIKY